jgi:hypothetical protein
MLVISQVTSPYSIKICNMAKLPVNIKVDIDPVKIQENNCCDEVLSVLKAVRPVWFNNETANSIKSNVRFLQFFAFDLSVTFSKITVLTEIHKFYL